MDGAGAKTTDIRDATNIYRVSKAYKEKRSVVLISNIIINTQVYIL
jgi:hypothetical protein